MKSDRDLSDIASYVARTNDLNNEEQLAVALNLLHDTDAPQEVIDALERHIKKVVAGFRVVDLKQSPGSGSRIVRSDFQSGQPNT